MTTLAVQQAPQARANAMNGVTLQRRVTASSEPAYLQPKLTLNHPGDNYEREADRIAEQVMRMPDAHAPNAIGLVATIDNAGSARELVFRTESVHPEEQFCDELSKEPDPGCAAIIECIETLIEAVIGRIRDIEDLGGDPGHEKRLRIVQEILRALITKALLSCRPGEFDPELEEEARRWVKQTSARRQTTKEETGVPDWVWALLGAAAAAALIACFASGVCEVGAIVGGLSLAARTAIIWALEAGGVLVLQNARVMPKLKVNQPSDQYEQEADRVADMVMRMPEPQMQRQCACGKSSTEGECSECKKKKKEAIGSLQRVASSPVGGIAAPRIVSDVLSSPGSPLPTATRSFMESRFGQDFSHVRVHTDQLAAESAAAVRARAYTVGSQVVFGRGEHPSQDQHLLAHELTHVLQQSTIETSNVQRQEVPPIPKTSDALAEREFDTETVQLGKRLAEHDGVSIAIFPNNSNAYFQQRAEVWAKRRNSLGTGGKNLSAKNLRHGLTMNDAADVPAMLAKIGAILEDARASQLQFAKGHGVELNEAAFKINEIAVFSHGTSSWCGVSGLSANSFSQATKYFADDVKIILYACSVGSSTSKEFDPTGHPDELRGTLDPGGGGDSLASRMRDSMKEAGAKNASLWAHSTVGNAVSNPAWREFRTADAKGAEGHSYAGGQVFDAATLGAFVNEIIESLRSQGKVNVEKKGERLLKRTRDLLRWEVLLGYGSIVRPKPKSDDSLAEDIPLRPSEIAGQVRKEWTESRWAVVKETIVMKLTKEFSS